MANSKGTKARFGSIRALPSGRYQARYTGPDGLLHKAPFTFDTKGDAETWLADGPRRHRARRVEPERCSETQGADLRQLRGEVAHRPPAGGPDPRALPIAARPADPADVRRGAAQAHHARPGARVVRDHRPGPSDAQEPRLRPPAHHPGEAERDSLITPQPLPRPRRRERPSARRRSSPPPSGSWRRSSRRCPSATADDPARLLVRSAVRGAGRAAPGGRRHTKVGILHVRRGVVRAGRRDDRQEAEVRRRHP